MEYELLFFIIGILLGFILAEREPVIKATIKKKLKRKGSIVAEYPTYDDIKELPEYATPLQNVIKKITKTKIAKNKNKKSVSKTSTAY